MDVYISQEAAWNGIYNCPTKTDADGYIWVRTKDVAHMIDNIFPADVVPLGEYNHLLKLAKAMHTWIFLHTSDEQKAYDECHLTDEDNAMLGYGGQFIITEGGDKHKNET